VKTGDVHSGSLDHLRPPRQPTGDGKKVKHPCHNPAII
jgi:hypothetical protein